MTDKLTDKEVEAFMDFVKTGLARGQHSVVFCSNYQFCRWYQIFAALKQKPKEAEALGDYINNVILKRVLTIHSKPLKLVHTNCYYNCSTGNFNFNKFNMVELAVHL